MAQSWSLAWAACGADVPGFVRATLQGPRTPSPASPRRTSPASRIPPSLGLASLEGSTTRSVSTLRVSDGMAAGLGVTQSRVGGSHGPHPSQGAVRDEGDVLEPSKPSAFKATRLVR